MGNYEKRENYFSDCNENSEELWNKYDACQTNSLNASIKLENAGMALRELLEKYEWAHEPSAEKALYYGNTIPGQREEDKDAERSWLYIYDYKKIMWLINVAYDYCNSALDYVNASLEV